MINQTAVATTPTTRRPTIEAWQIVTVPGATAAATWSADRLVRLEEDQFGVDGYDRATLLTELAAWDVWAAVTADGDVLGYLGTEPLIHRTGEYWSYIATVVVAAEAQGHGIGRALVCAAMDAMRTTVHNAAATNTPVGLELGVRGDNAVARRLYASLGFTEQYRAENTYVPDGERDRTQHVLQWRPTTR